MRFWRRIPFALILTTVWLTVKAVGANTEAGGLIGIVLILLSFLALVIEFFKSADIGVRSFMIDTVFSVVATVTVTVIMTKAIITEGLVNLHFPDYLFGFVILVDAVLSPVMSFSMALRNISGNVGTREEIEAN